MRMISACLAGTLLALAADARAQGPVRVYFGTYTEGTDSKGIYSGMFDPQTGTISDVELDAVMPNPSFLALHPSGKFLYAVAELDRFGGEEGGGVKAWALDADGKIDEPIDEASSKGAAPCHLSVHPRGDGLIVANYGSGTVSVYKLAADGRLDPLGVVFRSEKGSGADPRRQEGPHAHCVRFDPRGAIVIEADLGADRLHSLRFEPDDPKAPLRAIAETRTAPAAGPRHLAFHPSGRFVFVNNEMNSTVTAYRFDASSGALDEIQTESTLPEGGHPGNSTAETVIHPTGRFLYVSNRGHDSLAIFSVDEQTGTLVARGHQKTGGKTPRNFNIDPTGRWLLAANQSSDTITVFAIDPESGVLTPRGEPVRVPAPVCVVFQARPVGGR